MPDENESSATEAVRQDRSARARLASAPGGFGLGGGGHGGSGMLARVYDGGPQLMKREAGDQVLPMMLTRSKAPIATLPSVET